jgi:hypothetical protein
MSGLGDDQHPASLYTCHEVYEMGHDMSGSFVDFIHLVYRVRMERGWGEGEKEYKFDKRKGVGRVVQGRSCRQRRRPWQGTYAKMRSGTDQASER